MSLMETRMLLTLLAEAAGLVGLFVKDSRLPSAGVVLLSLALIWKV